MSESVNFSPSRVYFSHKQKFNLQQNSLSPMMEIHPQLSLFLQISRSTNRVSPLQQSYSPAELSLDRVSSGKIFIIQGANPQLVILIHHPQQKQRNYGFFYSSQGFIFPNSVCYISISCSYIMTYAYITYNLVSFIFEERHHTMHLMHHI